MKARMQSVQRFPQGTIISPEVLDALVGKTVPFRDGKGTEIGTSEVTGWRISQEEGQVVLTIEHTAVLPDFTVRPMKDPDDFRASLSRPFHDDSHTEGELGDDRAARRALDPHAAPSGQSLDAGDGCARG